MAEALRFEGKIMGGVVFKKAGRRNGQTCIGL
jgi:hypothetical protein